MDADLHCQLLPHLIEKTAASGQCPEAAVFAIKCGRRLSAAVLGLALTQKTITKLVLQENQISEGEVRELVSKIELLFSKQVPEALRTNPLRTNPQEDLFLDEAKEFARSLGEAVDHSVPAMDGSSRSPTKLARIARNCEKALTILKTIVIDVAQVRRPLLGEEVATCIRRAFSEYANSDKFAEDPQDLGVRFPVAASNKRRKLAGFSAARHRFYWLERT